MDSLSLEEVDVADFRSSDFSLGALESIEADISAIARAIEKLDDGSYGRCEQCNAEIAPLRLAHDPLVTRCDAHVVRGVPDLWSNGTEIEPHGPVA